MDEGSLTEALIRLEKLALACEHLGNVKLAAIESYKRSKAREALARSEVTIYKNYLSDLVKERDHFYDTAISAASRICLLYVFHVYIRMHQAGPQSLAFCNRPLPEHVCLCFVCLYYQKTKEQQVERESYFKSRIESEAKRVQAALKAKEREIFAAKEKQMATEQNLKKTAASNRHHLELLKQVRLRLLEFDPPRECEDGRQLTPPEGGRRMRTLLLEPCLRLEVSPRDACCVCDALQQRNLLRRTAQEYHRLKERCKEGKDEALRIKRLAQLIVAYMKAHEGAMLASTPQRMPSPEMAPQEMVVAKEPTVDKPAVEKPLRQAFENLAGTQGTLDVITAVALSRKMGISASEEEIAAFYASVNGGDVTLEAFTAFCASAAHPEDVAEELASAFALWDPSSSGYITKQQLRHALTQFGEGLNPQEVNFALEKIAGPGDQVNYLQFCKKKPRRQARRRIIATLQASSRLPPNRRKQGSLDMWDACELILEILSVNALQKSGKLPPLSLLSPPSTDTVRHTPTANGHAQTTVDVEGSLPPYSSAWERHLAYNYGLYDPRRLHKALTPQQVAADVSLFKQTLETAEPQDACKYLQLEEFKCLREHQAHRDPETASTKCVKWFQEWRQCKWDQDKLQKGYAFAEDRLPAKHKPYIATPDTQYA
ncbi:hypothetical protein cyc_08072 [Cyclospora cayetanensis]|uniref:EF-hand domain-containing protein n=1 Tax=Cyclospora cayetanensis TaxID=88456 RepID=A0A1D3CX41_9EIME|nr:hypothetical protein cyc_08072 [Cyclospora cayetanensis]